MQASLAVLYKAVPPQLPLCDAPPAACLNPAHLAHLGRARLQHSAAQDGLPGVDGREHARLAAHRVAHGLRGGGAGAGRGALLAPALAGLPHALLHLQGLMGVVAPSMMRERAGKAKASSG